MQLMSKCALIIYLCWPHDAFALQPLRAFLDAAAQHGLDNRDARALLAQREGEAMQTWGKLLPSLSVTGTYTRNQQAIEITLPDSATTTRTITISALNQLDANLSASLTLIDVNAWVRTAAQVGTADAQRFRLQAAELETERQVARAHAVLVAAEALLLSTQKALAAQQAALKLTEERRAAGLAGELDVRRNKAEVARGQQNVSDAQYSLLGARRALSTLSGLTPEPVTQVSRLDDDLSPLPPSGDATVPALSAAKVELVASERSKVAAWTALVPTLTLQVNERITNAPSFGVNPFWSVVASARWTFDAGQIGSIRAQTAAAEQAHIRAERAADTARDQLEDARELVTSTIAKARAANSQLEEAQLAASLAKDRFAQGKATQLDVILAERDLLDAEVSRIRVFADLGYARALVTLNQGKSLR